MKTLRFFLLISIAVVISGCSGNSGGPSKPMDPATKALVKQRRADD